MGEINTTKDLEQELTINITKGEISYIELINWITDYYSGVIIDRENPI